MYPEEKKKAHEVRFREIKDQPKKNFTTKYGPPFKKSNHPLAIMVRQNFSMKFRCSSWLLIWVILPMYLGPVWTSGSADPSCDQQPTAPQVVYDWFVGLPAQPVGLRRFPCVPHIFCTDCAQSSIDHMYVCQFYTIHSDLKQFGHRIGYFWQAYKF